MFLALMQASAVETPAVETPAFGTPAVETPSATPPPAQSSAGSKSDEGSATQAMEIDSNQPTTAGEGGGDDRHAERGGSAESLIREGRNDSNGDEEDKLVY